MTPNSLTEEIALGLLYPIWRGIPAAYKMKYARSIWEQYENEIRSAAVTDSLAKFFDKLCLRLGVNIYKDDVDAVSGLLTHLNNRVALKAIRDETKLMVLLVQSKNDERKESVVQQGGLF